LYEKGEAAFVNAAEAEALLEIVSKDLNVQDPRYGSDIGSYIIPAVRRRARSERIARTTRENPSEQSCPIETPRGEVPYSFNTPTKN
jgi:hypothetical protein